jgi:hypothetical protein
MGGLLSKKGGYIKGAGTSQGLGFKKFKRFITVCEKAMDIDDSAASKQSNGSSGVSSGTGGKVDGGANMAGWYSPSWGGDSNQDADHTFLNPMGGMGEVGMSFEQGYGTNWDERRRESEFHGLGHVENTAHVASRTALRQQMEKPRQRDRETPASEKNMRIADATAKRDALDEAKRKAYEAKSLEKEKKAARLKRAASQGRRDRRGAKDKHAHRRAGGVLTLMCSKIDEEDDRTGRSVGQRSLLMAIEAKKDLQGLLVEVTHTGTNKAGGCVGTVRFAGSTLFADG